MDATILAHLQSKNISPRLATDDDFRAFFGREPPEAWFGLAAEAEGRIVGMGTVTWRGDHRGLAPRLIAWGSFDGRETLPAMMMHRLALRTLAYLKREGEPAIYAFCNHRVAGAERWLRHLGFAQDAPMTVDYGEHVWSRRLADG